MKLAQFGILGIVLQSVCLIGFVLISRTTFDAIGKAFVIFLACLGVVLLLYRGVRNASGPASLCLLPVTLAVGYIIAFHLVGVIGFGGLIRDVHPPYREYLWSVMHVTVTLFFGYGIATALLFALNRAWHGPIFFANKDDNLNSQRGASG